MILDVDGAGCGALGEGGRRGGMIDFCVRLDLDSVVTDGHAGIVRLFPVRAEAGGGELDVIRLPLQRRETHVHRRRLHAVDPAGLIVFALEPEGIEHLHFIPPLRVDAAVASLLPAGSRLVGGAEFEVKREALESRLAGGAGEEEPIGGHFCALLPWVQALAIEKDRGLGRRSHPFGWALAHDALELAEIHRAAFGRGEHAFVDRAGEPAVPCSERNLPVLGFTRAENQSVAIAIPAVARQATDIADGGKPALSQGDDLDAPSVCFEVANVFTLDRVIRIHLGRVRRIRWFG